MNDNPATRGIRPMIALLAALGALLVGLAGGAAVGGMLGYVAGERAAGGDVVVPAAIDRLGLVPRAPEATSKPAADDDSAGDAAADAGESKRGRSSGPADASDALSDADVSGAPDAGGAGRSKGGRQASEAGDRPRLGVEVATEPLAVDDYTAGARVMTVAPGSAAAEAGIDEGDVVVSVDGQPVRSSDDLAAAIAAHGAGDAVSLVVLRGEVELKFEVTLGAAQP